MDSVGNICEGATQTDLIASAFFCLFHRACHSGSESAGRRYLIATTIWEHWDSIKEDGSFWNDRKNSFNHYSYGCVFDWVYAWVLGIRPDDSEPAYRRFTLAPHPDKRLGYAEGSVRTQNGEVTSSWKYDGDSVTYSFDVPDGTVAEVLLPGREKQIFGKGKYTLSF